MQKSNKTACTPDRLSQAIMEQFPDQEENVSAAHYFVEAELVPKFREGMSKDIVQHHRMHDWTSDVQDASRAFASVCVLRVLNAKYVACRTAVYISSL